MVSATDTFWLEAGLVLPGPGAGTVGPWVSSSIRSHHMAISSVDMVFCYVGQQQRTTTAKTQPAPPDGGGPAVALVLGESKHA
jgi:hypothetical protein